MSASAHLACVTCLDLQVYLKDTQCGQNSKISLSYFHVISPNDTKYTT